MSSSRRRPNRSERPPPHIEKADLTPFENAQRTGSHPAAIPISFARRSRNVSDDAASAKSARTHAVRQKTGGRRRVSSNGKEREGDRRGGVPSDAGACCLSEASSRAKEGGMPLGEEPVFPDSSFTPNASTSSDSAAGIAASRKTDRRLSPIHPTSPAATSGPRTAPALSNPRWRPKAAPRRPGGAAFAIIVSRGAVRMPFPMRSTKRMKTTASQLGARPMIGRAREDRP